MNVSAAKSIAEIANALLFSAADKSSVVALRN